MPRLYFERYRSKLRYTHYLFRFPAKFHAPAVRCLLDRYTREGDLLLDPFCGSGTLLVEALVAGRNAVGVDIDPLATFVARVKSRVISPERLRADFERLGGKLGQIRRPSNEYDRLMFEDLSSATVANSRKALCVPEIPNIAHWFRNYVILDLARLRNAILESSFEAGVRNFFLACFAGVIRNASNADPVPVSGLEVTSHMRRLDEAGRRIDPFQLFQRRVLREIGGMEELWDESPESLVQVRNGDVTSLRSTVRARKFDAVITSPPYNTAVDYYRRHMLEMYWLGLVKTHEDRLVLAPQYLGRAHVREGHPRTKSKFDSGYVKRLIKHSGEISAARERTVAHYCASMQKALSQISHALKPRGKAVFVVGNAKWNGKKVQATRLLIELAKPDFTVEDNLSYASRNRYMSYSRHNGADVNWEHVVVLRKRD